MHRLADPLAKAAEDHSAGQDIGFELACFSGHVVPPDFTARSSSRRAGVESAHFSRHYLSCMSLVTDFTPPTLLATLAAPAISAREFTKPLN